VCDTTATELNSKEQRRRQIIPQIRAGEPYTDQQEASEPLMPQEHVTPGRHLQRNLDISSELNTRSVDCGGW